MGRIVVIGERERVAGFVLAGAEVVVAEDAGSARSALAALERDVAVVLLTPRAWAASRLDGPAEVRSDRRLTAVMPP